MLLSHFFLEGLPKYSETDDDLPNSVTLDEEDFPNMCLELNLKQSMICLDDEQKAIACLANVNLVMDKHTINKLKETLNPENTSDLQSSLRFNIVDFHPFFCDYEVLNGVSDFRLVWKWEIIQPFAVCFSSKTYLSLTDQGFELNKNTDINIEKIEIKFSIAEFASFTLMIENMMKILEDRYLSKVKEGNFKDTF